MRTIAVALLAFASTNLDDFFLLTLWFVKRTSPKIVALGQMAGFTAIILISVLGYFGTMLLPPSYIHWLGVLPITIGIKQLWSKRKDEHPPADNWWVVAAVTAAHGGDNIAVYTPLFARYALGDVALIIVCFYAALLLSVEVARIVAGKLAPAERFHKLAHLVSPFVIMLIGVGILLS